MNSPIVSPKANGELQAVAAGRVCWLHQKRCRSSLLMIGVLVALAATNYNLLFSLKHTLSDIIGDADEPYFADANSNQDRPIDSIQMQLGRSSLASNKQSKKHPPLSCSDVFHENRNMPRSGGDPNNGAMHARYTITDPAFWVALHKREYDGTRWAILDFGEYYETKETNSFANIIRADAKEQRRRWEEDQQQLDDVTPLPPLRVIDVGGNIGWYSLVVIAAAMEQHYPIIVDVFEPNPRNHRRLCESLFINEWLHHDQVAVNLYSVGVTSTTMASDPSQTGRIGISASGTGSLAAMRQSNLTGTVTFPLVSLDQMAKELDWTGSNQTISILKVDVEGFELDVFEGAQELLKSQAVQNVFFEGNLRRKVELKKFSRLAEIMVNNGYVAYKIGGYRGADELVKTTWTAPRMNNKKYIDGVKAECGIPRGKNAPIQCNMWWRLLSSFKT